MFTQENHSHASTAIVRFPVPNLDYVELRLPICHPPIVGHEFYAYDERGNEFLRGVVSKVTHFSRLDRASDAAHLQIDLALISYDEPLLRSVIG